MKDTQDSISKSTIPVVRYLRYLIFKNIILLVGAYGTVIVFTRITPRKFEKSAKGTYRNSNDMKLEADTVLLLYCKLSTLKVSNTKMNRKLKLQSCN